jgi:Na+/H+-translocating membrane pyrophosphatase
MEKSGMTKKQSTPKTGKSDSSVARIATIAAGATIGSAAIAAAVLFATRKRDSAENAPAKVSEKPLSDRIPIETD